MNADRLPDSPSSAIAALRTLACAASASEACACALEAIARGAGDAPAWIQHVLPGGVPRVVAARDVPDACCAAAERGLPWPAGTPAAPLAIAGDASAPAGSIAAALASAGVRGAWLVPVDWRGGERLGAIAWLGEPGAEAREWLRMVAAVLARVFERERATAGRRRLEQELAHAQRMQGVGGLAGAIAHDFNNMLTAMIGYMDLIAVGLPEGTEEQGYATLALEAAEQASDLTRRLLAFARRQPSPPKPEDLNAMLERLTPLVRRLMPENIPIATDLPGRPCWGLVDFGLAEQVVVNLALRARDVMPEGGTLRLALRQEAHAVTLEVSDDGPPLPDDERRYAFDAPDASLASPGTAALDLAIAARMVREGGGRIEALSGSDPGTVVRVHWPVAEPPAPPVAGRGGPPRGSERVLFVEDDPAVRSLGRAMLEKLGYEVIAAEGAEEALAALASGGRVHLLLADVVMPGMSGRELATRAASRSPGLRVLLTSGYAGDPGGPGLSDGHAFLPKPYSVDTLARRVRETLDAPPAEAGGASR